MMEYSFLDTVKALKELGFVRDDSVTFDSDEGLSYDFGNLQLSASQCLNRRFVEVILVSGVYATPRTIANIEMELPLQVSSIEHCAALLAYFLDNQLSDKFVPLFPCFWLELGRENFDTLYWIRKQRLYENRPKCYVNRDWLKLALRDLRLHLVELDENETLIFTFKDGIFSFRSRLKQIAFPATGKDWSETYEIKASRFCDFPKRIDNKEVEISVLDNKLKIHKSYYSIENKFKNP